MLLKTYIFIPSLYLFLMGPYQAALAKEPEPLQDLAAKELYNSFKKKTYRQAEDELSQNQFLKNRILPYIPQTIFYTLPANGFGNKSLPSYSISRTYKDFAKNMLLVAHSEGLSLSEDSGATYLNRTTANGLGSNLVRDVTVTDTGGQVLIFAATSNGLSRSSDYGMTFSNISFPSYLENFNDVTTVFADGKNIYVGTKNGLAITSDGGFSFFYKLIGNEIASVFAKGAMVYVGTSKGLFVSTNGGADYVNKPLFEYNLNPDFTRINALFAGQDKVFVGTKNGLVRANMHGNVTGRSFEHQTVSAVFASDNSVYAIVDNRGRGNHLWKSIDGGNNFQQLGKVDSFSKAFTLFANGQYVWVGADDGFYVSDDDGAAFQSHKFSQTNALGDSTNKVMVRNNNIYLGTSGGLAISRDDGKSFVLNEQIDNLLEWSPAYIDDIFDNGDKIFFAVGSNLIVSGNAGETFQSVLSSEKVGDSKILKIHGINNTVALGTSDGLWLSTDGGENFFHLEKMEYAPNSEITAVFVDGDRIYAGTEEGLFIFDGHGFKQITKDDGLPSNKINSVFKNGDYLYVGTSKGLAISNDDKNFVVRTNLNGLGSSYVWKVFVDDNAIYVGTNSGLSISLNDGQSFRNFTTADGLGCNEINDIFVNAEGKLYIVTGCGLAVNWRSIRSL